MKKILTILCVVLLLAGCTSTQNQEEINQEPEKQEEVIGGNTVNPMTEIESLEALNDEVHGKLNHPGVMGVENEKFFTIKVDDVKTIGQYTFTINGNECCMRFCDRALPQEDISGIYVDGKSAFPSENVVDQVEYNKLDNTLVARWFNIDGQYTFAYTNSEITQKDFENIIKEMITITMPEQGEVIK